MLRGKGHGGNGGFAGPDVWPLRSYNAMSHNSKILNKIRLIESEIIAIPSSVYYVADEESLQEVPDSPQDNKHQCHHGRDAHGAIGKDTAVKEQDAEFGREGAGAEEHIEREKELSRWRFRQ